MSAKLTVLIPCKNERLNIRRCIESARLIADEVLIADSGSTDDTLAIVAAMGGCRVIERPFTDFSDFKNWAIPQAQHVWVLILDADERISPELAVEIRATLAGDTSHVDGWWIGRQNHFMGYRIRHCGWNSDAVFRLIRRDVCRYTNRRVHEEIAVPAARAGRLRQELVHYTVWTYEQYFRKFDHYTTLSALDMRDRGRRATLGSMIGRPPLRFLQLYVLRLGFLDGLPGLQICWLTAFMGFVKQAKLWALTRARPQPNPEAQAAGDQLSCESSAAISATSASPPRVSRSAA